MALCLPWVPAQTEIHNPTDHARLAYLATTKAGRRVYLNRTLVEADFLIVLSSRAYDPASGHGGMLAALARSGVTLLNQSVLLAGVNDDADVLTELSERLFDHGVLPYYLHLPDRVVGTHHFDVTPHTGRTLIAALRARLPGYLVPRLVKEVPGESAKRPVDGA